MPPSSGKTTLEVLIERIGWIKETVESIVEKQEELREEIKEDLVNVGDLETLRANYIAADARLEAERKKEIAELQVQLDAVKKTLEHMQQTHVTWVTLKWIGVVVFLIGLIIAGVNRDQIVQWVLRIL